MMSRIVDEDIPVDDKSKVSFWVAGGETEILAERRRGDSAPLNPEGEIW
jgi:hypothetical protein